MGELAPTQRRSPIAGDERGQLRGAGLRPGRYAGLACVDGARRWCCCPRTALAGAPEPLAHSAARITRRRTRTSRSCSWTWPPTRRSSQFLTATAARPWPNSARGTWYAPSATAPAVPAMRARVALPPAAAERHPVPRSRRSCGTRKRISRATCALRLLRPTIAWTSCWSRSAASRNWRSWWERNPSAQSIRRPRMRRGCAR